MLGVIKLAARDRRGATFKKFKRESQNKVARKVIRSEAVECDAGGVEGSAENWSPEAVSIKAESGWSLSKKDAIT